MKDDLLVLQELTSKLRRARMARGALDLDLPEARVVTDPETGAPIEVKKRATRPGIKSAYSLVEEMMLLANELVARWLTERSIPAIYRVHDLPDEEKLERLATVAKKLEIPVNLNELREPLGAAEFLARAQKHPRHRALTMLLLRSLKQAMYDTKNVGHFGLASPAYVHFTSPIRRYPDLRIHRQIKKLLRGGRVDRSPAALEDLQAAATDSSKKERAAMDVERQVLDLYRAYYMQRHIGDSFKGVVTGISGTGLYVSLEDPFCDVLIPFDALGLDQFETDDEEISVTARRSGETIMLGDPISLEVTDVAIGRRTVLGRRVRTGDDDLAGMEPWLNPPGGTRRGDRVPRTGPGRRSAAPAGRGDRRLGARGPSSSRGKKGSERDETPRKSFKPSRAAGGRGDGRKPSSGTAKTSKRGTSRTKRRR
jgi:ribonuclease R